MLFQLFGAINNPLPQISPGRSYGALQSGGLISFASNVIKVIIVLGGVWAFLNLILAGFRFLMSSGNPEGIATAWRQIYMSLIGLVLMVSAYLLAVIMGVLLFQDPTAILSPQLFGP